GADRVEAAERAGLVRVVTTRRRRDVTLAHGLHGDVLRAELGAMAAGRLARTHAESAEARGSRRAGDPWRVALWRLAADGRAPGGRTGPGGRCRAREPARDSRGRVRAGAGRGGAAGRRGRACARGALSHRAGSVAAAPAVVRQRAWPGPAAPRPAGAGRTLVP